MRPAANGRKRHRLLKMTPLGGEVPGAVLFFLCVFVVCMSPPQLFEYVFYIYIEINLYFCGIKGAIEVLGWIADPSLKALTASFLS